MMNYFIFDGESSLNYGVYIGGQNTFNAPQRDVAKVAIPGRNGDLIQDNGRFLNVQVPYNIVVMDDFKDKTDAIKAWLLSKKGYCKLVDTYHPGTYRMARVAGGIDFETAAYNLTGKTQVIFDCKPERFLDSGDDVFQVGVWGQTESASGDVVTFEGNEYEAFRSIAASISPTQDLHGYDYPWPAGGGKNKIDQSKTYQQGLNQLVLGQETVYSTRSIFLTAGTYTVSVALSGGKTASIYLATDSDTGGSGIGNTNAARSFTLESDSHVGILLYNANGITASDLVSVQLESGSTATAWTPYSNICPISGETEATVTRAGKNLLDYTTAQSGRGLTVSVSNDGVVTVSGVPLAGTVFFVDFTDITDLLEDGATYTISQSPIFGPEMYMEIRAEKAEGGYVYRASTAGESTAKTFVVDKSQYKKFDVYCVARRGDWGDEPKTLSCTFQLEKGNTATPFTPYSGTIFPVTWQSEAGTVYGGTVDVVSGELVVDRAMMYVDGSQNIYNVGYHGSSGLYYTVITNNLTSQEGDPSLISNRFRNAYNIGIGDCYVTGLGTTLVAVLPDQTITTREQAKQWFVDNPTQFVYALATPQTHQLTGEEIEVLVGTNNVWADIGSVDVEWSINPHIVRNPTRFASKPKMRVKGSGNGTVTVENGTITISNLNEYVDIDSELMNCYKGTANKNADVALPYHEYPELKPGGNYIDFSGGITEVEVKGRWWTI